MKKSLVFFVGFILVFGVLTITAIINQTGSWHLSDYILVTIDGYKMTLSEVIDNNVLSEGATQSYTIEAPNPGHEADEIWVSVNGDEKTLQSALSVSNGLCGSSSTISYFSIPSGLIYQFANEIQISPGTSLQDAIDTSVFCYYDFLLSKLFSFEFDTSYASYNSLQKIDSTHYLNVYTGVSGTSFIEKAVVLEVNPSTWQVSKPSSTFESSFYGIWNSVEQIDSTHYLNTYLGKDSDGYAVVLEVNPSTWQVTAKTPFEFDTSYASYNSLQKIDSTHYLNTYYKDNNNYAVVLEVNPSTWQVSKPSSALQFAGNGHSSLQQIDSTHFLATYRSSATTGYVAVLEVNPSTWQVTAKTPFEFHSYAVESNSLQQIDSTHYLNVYRGASGNYGGYAVVLEVNPSTWQVSKPSSSLEFDFSQARDNSLQKIDSTHFIDVYNGADNKNFVAILEVNPSTWQISKPISSFEFDSISSNYRYNSLQQIDSNHFLDTYYGSGEDGYAVVLQVA